MNTQSRNHLTEMIQLRKETASLMLSSCSSPLNNPHPSSLSDATPRRVKEFLDEGAQLIPELEEHLDCLQEVFVSLMEHQFAQENFKPSNRLHIYLSAEGKIVVEGSDDEAEKVCAIFSREPQLLQRFKDLARLALLTHGLSVAQCANSDIEENADAEVASLIERYHMCLKGKLSHFYVL